MTQVSVDVLTQGITIRASPDSAVPTLKTPVVKEYVDAPPYEGAYEITPSSEDQVIDAVGMRMMRNLTVKAVPSTYGRIDWNGSYLTVY